jgi:hypothetical protein
MQNAHRYFFYAAFVISIVNTYDAVVAFFGDNGFQMGLGNLILLGNVLLLWSYTLSCHSCRHIMGGRLNAFSRHPLRYRAWTFISKLNGRHMELAWITLGTLFIRRAPGLSVSRARAGPRHAGRRAGIGPQRPRDTGARAAGAALRRGRPRPPAGVRVSPRRPSP